MAPYLLLVGRSQAPKVFGSRLLRKLTLAVAIAATMGTLGASKAGAQTGANVLVVINSGSPASKTIGERYVARRAVPDRNLCTIRVPIAESVSREDYEAQIEQPIWTCLASQQLQDRILYIVLTKDVPIRISGTNGRSGTNSSVDSELTLLYRRRNGTTVPVGGFVPNPYYADAATPVEPFTHRKQDIYLVTRLDGYSVDDALALIERGSNASADGLFVLDPRLGAGDLIPNRWMAAAAERLAAQGLRDRVPVDRLAHPVTGESSVLGYYSWGSNDDAGRRRTWDFKFPPGALAGMLVSTDGRTFKEPPASWRPGDTGSFDSRFAGTADSLTADLIRAGVTGASGNVDEPYLDASIRPDILFPAYVSGRNLAESFYAAMPYLSWQTVIVGDPLCAPFSRASLAADETDPPMDATTELPVHFGRRLLAALYPAISREATAAFIRFQSRVVLNDVAGARYMLEAAIALEPQFIPARIELATLNERIGKKDEAIEQYRAILSYSPNDPLALNNLAYGLAVHHHKPEEALPLAERATIVAKDNSAIAGGSSVLNAYTLGTYRREPLVPYSLDTLAWVQHLLGRDADAANTITEALAVPGGYTPDMRWHAAVIFASVNDLTKAAAELNAAITADPTLAERAECQKLREQLSARKF